MRKVAIIGVGITPFRARYLDKTYFELAYDATKLALDDANKNGAEISHKDLQSTVYGIYNELFERQFMPDIVVSRGSMTDVDTSLAGEFTEMEEFVVQDLDLAGSSEIGVLKIRMESPSLMDSISSELISRAGASDGGAAAGAKIKTEGDAFETDRNRQARGVSAKDLQAAGDPGEGAPAKGRLGRGLYRR